MNILPQQVLATNPALALIEKLKARHGELMFHQSGGCCDGSSPMCYADGDFLVGSADVWLGEIDGCDFLQESNQAAAWPQTLRWLTLEFPRPFDTPE